MGAARRLVPEVFPFIGEPWGSSSWLALEARMKVTRKKIANVESKREQISDEMSYGPSLRTCSLLSTLFAILFFRYNLHRAPRRPGLRAWQEQRFQRLFSPKPSKRKLTSGYAGLGAQGLFVSVQVLGRSL
jgi:hypothetical protein